MANVSSNNLTTLYSGGGVNIRPTSAYGNSNVVALLNVGTDGGNTVTNIVATGNLTIGNITANGNVTADYFIGNFVANVSNANYANFAGDVVNSTQSNITSVGNLINLRVENANVHLGTNAGLGNIGTDIIAIGNNSAASNIVISTNFVSWDGGGFVLEVTDTTGIDRGYTVSGTGFTLGQTVNSVIDSGNLQMNDDADGTPSGVMTFSSMQGNTSVAIGNNAGYTTQSAGSVAIGNSAGYTGQFSQSVAVGDRAGETNQGGGSLALGGQAGKDTQGDQSTAIGSLAGSNNQSSFAVAIGALAGQTVQGFRSVAIGFQAGSNTQGGFSVSIGDRAAISVQGANSVAIGSRAGNSSQGINSVAIGANAAFASQGANSIAIGKNAGKTSQANNSIILNATGANLNQTTANTFTVKPVRQANTANIMFYDNTTGEISYDVISISNVANANYANFAGDVVNSAQPNITSVGNTLSSGQLSLNTTTAGEPVIQLNGVVGSSNGYVQINQGFLQINNEDLSAGQSPFQFNITGNNAHQEPMNYSRSRGTSSSPLDCVPGDDMLAQRWQVRANGSTQSVFLVAATYLGYTSGLGPYSRYNFTSVGDVANTEIIFNSGIIKMQGNVTLGTSTGNTVVANNSLFALSVYTAAALTAITGTVGQMACVSDSAFGLNPNGMIAFWDTTNSRWSYVHDNSAV